MGFGILENLAFDKVIKIKKNMIVVKCDKRQQILSS